MILSKVFSLHRVVLIVCYEFSKAREEEVIEEEGKREESAV